MIVLRFFDWLADLLREPGFWWHRYQQLRQRAIVDDLDRRQP